MTKRKRCGTGKGKSLAAWFMPLFLCFLLAVQLLQPAAGRAEPDRYFSFPQVLIEAEVHPDGSMTVVEERTFDFSGLWQGMTNDIRLVPGIDITGVAVSEGSQAYTQKPAGTTGTPGIFFVDRDDRNFYIDWSFYAYNERRTFVISYRVENAVVVHLDTAELYWQFIGDDTDSRVSSARVSLTLPPGAIEEDIRAWAHGPLHGELTIEGSTRVVWAIDDLPQYTFLEGRVTFPVELVPEANRFSGEERLEAILAEEEREARRANLQRALLRFDFIFGPLMILAAVIFYLILRRKAVRHPDAYKGDYYRELPADYSPAEAGYLARRGSTRPEDFTATIMDLTRRGHLRLEEYTGEEGWIRKHTFTDYRAFPGEGKDSLTGHEQSLYNFLFHRVCKGPQDEGVTFRDIEEYAKKRPEAMQSFYKSWQKIIVDSEKKRSLFGGIAVPGIIAGIIILAAGVVCNVNDLYIAGIAGFFAGFFLLVGSALLKKLTPKGADHYAKWQAFKRFLLHFSEMSRSTIPSLQVWEHYLVYAVALGVAKEVISQLQLVFPELKEAPMVRGSALSGIGLIRSGAFNTVNTSVQQSFRAAFRSSSSSGSGRGGGFSGGGGGGGGGGGFRGR